MEKAALLVYLTIVLVIASVTAACIAYFGVNLIDYAFDFIVFYVLGT